MSILNKLFTAIRGAASEAGEAAVDSQALRILDQEIRDADADLRKAKDSLAQVMAKRKRADNKVSDLTNTIEDYEKSALKALEQGNEDLAREVAERIGQLEHDRNSEQALAEEFKASEKHLRDTISRTEGNLKRMKQQVETVKATEAVQKAQAAVAARHSGASSSMRSALDSLDRIKERQADRAARFEAAQEIDAADGTDDLDAKLAKAGIKGSGTSSADDILARLRKD